ncbi:MAG: Octanoyltransferase LipM [Chlamydiales bacterium]|nr:Octanoyltransferase LipM [Chlamydiales bacterium]MCH9619970.1 Octanoyltransferase LipM [Chlamydiales bacterium]MCH9622603.1 Octanoyltransferase LipM [Chlamydiales bacterium]
MHLAAENMALDSALLEDLAIDKMPIVHFYEWEQNAVTYGHFVDPKKFLKKRDALDLAKRPTGGGMLFHLADFAFSVIVPADHPSYSNDPLESYAFINKKVSRAASHLGAPALLKETPKEGVEGFCMAKPTKYDVMVGGQKMGGAAQRRTRNGYLHQGTISLGLLSKEFLETFLKEEVVEAMHNTTFAPLGSKWTQKELEEARALVKHRLQEEFLCEN